MTFKPFREINMSVPLDRLQRFWRILSAFFFGWLFLISIHWLALGLEGEPLFTHWFHDPESHHRGWTLAVTFGLVILSSYWLYRHRRRYLPVRSLSRTASSKSAYTHLILIVSTPNLEPVLPRAGELFPLPIGTAVLQGASLKDDIESLNAVRWNWQQLLRALQALTESSLLQCVYLIGSFSSPDSKGSYEWLDTCKALVEHYLPKTEIVKFHKPVDFENLADLLEAINSIIQQAKQQGAQEKGIIIDATGGQKTASIAASLATLHNKVAFQYVQTHKPYEVFAYDVISENHFSLPE